MTNAYATVSRPCARVERRAFTFFATMSDAETSAAPRRSQRERKQATQFSSCMFSSPQSHASAHTLLPQSTAVNEARENAPKNPVMVKLQMLSVLSRKTGTPNPSPMLRRRTIPRRSPRNQRSQRPRPPTSLLQSRRKGPHQPRENRVEGRLRGLLPLVGNHGREQPSSMQTNWRRRPKLRMIIPSLVRALLTDLLDCH